ncbi:MAG TPA: cytochrome P450 [Candidatus Binataceae bacterium]|nr:cytochrome P450 [Candidatus Binataceae bacterium]
MSAMAEQAANAGLSFNPWDENFRRNPYSFYSPLRLSPPPVLRFFIPVAVLSRYDDVLATLHDQVRFSSAPVRNRMTIETAEVFGDAPSLISSDPPGHTRMRKLVSRDFSPRAIRELEPRVRALTATLLDEVARKRNFDLVADFALPLPVRIIASILGIPGERWETFKRWSDTLIELTTLPPGTPVADSVRANLVEMRGYFAEEIERRRRHPGADLMSSLVSAREDEEMLGASELMHFLVILLFAGTETTTNLIANGMLALQNHPEQMNLLRKDPTFMQRAIEEMLRYDSPVQSVFRTAKEDVEIGGTAIEKGSGIFLMLGSANRDPAKFANPDVFDITREQNDHVSFGEGIHYCLGAPLARLEGAVAFSAMLNRFPHLSLDGNPKLDYKTSFFVRSLNSLPMVAE